MIDIRQIAAHAPASFPRVMHRPLSAENPAMFATNFLLASLFWGSLGTGCLIYGKKLSSAPALMAGLALIACSYFAPGALWMSFISLLLMGGMVWGIRRGY